MSILRPNSAIYVMNASTIVPTAEVKDWCHAVGVQVSTAAHAWGAKAKSVKFVQSRLLIPRDAWIIVVMDDADQAGALGYHTVDSRGRVYGKVFARTAVKYGEEPSVTFSHEVLETWGDPDVRWQVDTGKGYAVPLELCDAVEGSSYVMRGVKVSNFLYPAWFGLPNKGIVAPDAYDALGRVNAPFTLDQGGYTVRVFPDGGTDQVFGETANSDYIKARSHELSRSRRIAGSKNG